MEAEPQNNTRYNIIPYTSRAFLSFSVDVEVVPSRFVHQPTSMTSLPWPLFTNQHLCFVRLIPASGASSTSQVGTSRTMDSEQVTEYTVDTSERKALRQMKLIMHYPVDPPEGLYTVGNHHIYKQHVHPPIHLSIHTTPDQTIDCHLNCFYSFVGPVIVASPVGSEECFSVPIRTLGEVDVSVHSLYHYLPGTPAGSIVSGPPPQTAVTAPDRLGKAAAHSPGQC